MPSRSILLSSLSLAVVLALSLVLRALDVRLAVAMLVLLSAVVGASLLGRVPGTVAALASAASLSWPLATADDQVQLTEGEDVVALVVFLVVALVVGSLVAEVDQARAGARQRELEAELSHSRAAFFAAAGHNLRTPLATIQASASALVDAGDRLDPAERDELLQTIRSETDRLARLVDKVLSLSRINAGGLDPELGPVDLEGLAQVAVGRLGPSAAGRSVRLDIPPDLGPLRLDVTMAEQVLLNLLENAVRYAPTGSEVLVSAERCDEVVELRVVDHGPGIAEVDRDRVFDAYVRGDQHGDVEGTGLGLAIVRALVLAQGGSVACEATPGGGATMVVRFPVTGASSTPPGATDDRAADVEVTG